MLTIQDLRAHAMEWEARWEVRPVITLACAGYTDEHWQLWHPDDRVTPGGVQHMLIEPDGRYCRHPDSTR